MVIDARTDTQITSASVLKSGPFGHAAASEGHTGQNAAGGISFSVTQPLRPFCFLHFEPCPLCPLRKLYKPHLRNEGDTFTAFAICKEN